MKNGLGSNSHDIKAKNRGLVLRLICTRGPISRGEIAKKTGLTKMTATNIISELLEDGVVQETKSSKPPVTAGRIPFLIDVAPTSPVICGVFIDRRDCHVLLFDYKVNILAGKKETYGSPANGWALAELIIKLAEELRGTTKRTVTGIGVALPGPLNTVSGTILSPPNFHGIHDFPLAEVLEEGTGLPCVLINDAHAGALAEQIYGYGRNLSDFIYLQFHQGIGAGLVIRGALASGALGLAGEIGHTSINFAGPPCPCGNCGCLELYASAEQVEKRAAELLAHREDSAFATKNPSWPEIVASANRGGAVARESLEPFCGHVAVALANYLNLTDCHMVLLGYEGENRNGFIEQALEQKVNSKLLAREYRQVEIRRSSFGSRAPVIGSAAVIANAVFSGTAPLYGRKRRAGIK